jgi:hypothetical protein
MLGPFIPVLPLLAFVYVAPDAVVTCAPTGAASCALELLFAVFLNVFTIVGFNAELFPEALDFVFEFFAELDENRPVIPLNNPLIYK